MNQQEEQQDEELEDDGDTAPRLSSAPMFRGLREEGGILKGGAGG